MDNKANERSDLAESLRQMANANRQQAESLMAEAEAMERAAALLAPDIKGYDTVDPAELSDEIKETAQLDIEAAIKRAQAEAARPTAATARPLQAAGIRDSANPILADRIVEMLTRERTNGAKLSQIVSDLGCSLNGARMALNGLVERRIVVRLGGQRGPGVRWVLADIPPLMPDPPDRSLPKEDDRPKPIEPPARPVKIEKPLQGNAATENKAAVIIECLIERGDKGMRPSELRGEVGMVPAMFDALMNQLMDRNIVAKMPDDGGVGKIYVLKLVGADLKAALSKISVSL